MRQLESWQCSRTSRKFSQASNLQGTQRFPEHCTIPSPNIFSILFGMSETYHQDTSLLEWVEMGQLAISLVTANLRKQALEPDCQGSKLGPATGTLWLKLRRFIIVVFDKRYFLLCPSLSPKSRGIFEMNLIMLSSICINYNFLTSEKGSVINTFVFCWIGSFFGRKLSF